MIAKALAKSSKLWQLQLVRWTNYLQQMINSSLLGLLCKQYSAMLAAHKEWKRMVKREPKLAAVCVGLLDLLCSVDKPLYHQHMKMIDVFSIKLIA